jgi:hypothetical protein
MPKLQEKLVSNTHNGKEIVTEDDINTMTYLKNKK